MNTTQHAVRRAPNPRAPYTLMDLPLEFRPRKFAIATVCAVVIVLEVMAAIGFESSARWPLEAFFTKGLITTLSFLFMVGACVWGIVQAYRRKDRLVIDEDGVLLDLNGVVRSWRWADMGRFHLVLVHARSNLHAVAIEPKGQRDFDAKANIIWPRFGPSTSDLIKLFQAGKARWGAVQTAAPTEAVPR